MSKKFFQEYTFYEVQIEILIFLRWNSCFKICISSRPRCYTKWSSI